VLATPLHADLTIGIDVKHQTAGFTVVGRNGLYVGAHCQQSRQKEQLLKGQVLTSLEKIIREESHRLGRAVRSIVIHRDGRCWQSEIDGATTAVAKLQADGIVEPNGTLTILEISKSAPVRLRFFESIHGPGGRMEVHNPQVGQYAILNGDEGFVCSTGRAFPHKGTVQPLHVRCVLEGMPFANALEDVYALTVLAYSRPDDSSRYPLTIKLTDRWLDEDASEYDSDALRFETDDDQQELERAKA
jgi:argonaute-like protein implicated in RNA metabolism and viral defense